jgi:predicted kinase
LIVEFAGLPGAGKTTTAERAAALLQARGYRCAWRPALATRAGDRLSHRVRFLWFRLVHWRIVVDGLRHALAIRPVRFSRARYTKHLLFLAYYQRQQLDGDYDIVLMDQSVVQTMWASTVGHATLKPRAIRAALRTLYRTVSGSMAFIRFEIDPATAARRVVGRAAAPKRFDNLPLAEVERTFVSRQETLGSITRQAIEITGAPSLAVDGALPSDANAARVADFLAALLGAGTDDLDSRTAGGRGIATPARPVPVFRTTTAPPAVLTTHEMRVAC